jgi:putative ABC transport system permease protein
VERAIPLDLTQLAIASLLVVVAGGVSMAVRARVEKKLAIGSVRTVVQLFLLGFVLQYVFAIDHPLPLIALVLVMTALAGREAVARSGRVFPGAHVGAFVTLVLTGTITTFAVTSLVIGVAPWWRPQYVVPLLGMVLGNGLTGISLCLDQILEQLDAGRDRVETELAMGATRWEAMREPLADAVRKGMIPILSSMAVVGIVAIPGMMTGQILEGADPAAAVRYQIVVMFMVAGATSLGCVGIALVAYRRLFNARHQLRRERISKRKP